MLDFEEALSQADEQTSLCIGDLMLDDFVYGDAEDGLLVGVAQRLFEIKHASRRSPKL